MEGRNRNITKVEMLLAISLSQFYMKTHVHYIPPRTNFTKMLKVLRSEKLVKPCGLSNYELTRKGRDYLIRYDKPNFTKQDAAVDNFIKELENNNCFGR